MGGHFDEKWNAWFSWQILAQNGLKKPCYSQNIAKLQRNPENERGALSQGQNCLPMRHGKLLGFPTLLGWKNVCF